MRWEMRPRLFLRTAEFLWQEGHTAHETAEEAMEDAKRCTKCMRLPPRSPRHPGDPRRKTERERFPGAVNTFTVEAMVQDRKAIQAGTSHLPGPEFREGRGIQFLGRDNNASIAWTTSWGVSTRLIGTLIMAHGDDDGVIMPPRVAPHQIVILPVTPKPDTRQEIIDACEALAQTLHPDLRPVRPARACGQARPPRRPEELGVDQEGRAHASEMGPRDITSRSVAVARRDKGPKEKEFIGKEEFLQGVQERLADIQQALLDRATTMRDANMKKLDTFDEFKAYFADENGGGFALMHWAGTMEEEEKIAKENKITIRCIPHGDQYAEEGKCFLTGRPSSRRVVFARSY
jgi:prolyl-tRNA synthetase